MFVFAIGRNANKMRYQFICKLVDLGATVQYKLLLLVPNKDVLQVKS